MQHGKHLKLRNGHGYILLTYDVNLVSPPLKLLPNMCNMVKVKVNMVFLHIHHII